MKIPVRYTPHLLACVLLFVGTVSTVRPADDEAMSLQLSLVPGEVLSYRSTALRTRKLTSQQIDELRDQYDYPHDRVQMQFDCERDYYVLDVTDEGIADVVVTHDIRIRSETPLENGPRERHLKLLSLMRIRPDGSLIEHLGDASGFSGSCCGMLPVALPSGLSSRKPSISTLESPDPFNHLVSIECSGTEMLADCRCVKLSIRSLEETQQQRCARIAEEARKAGRRI